MKNILYPLVAALCLITVDDAFGQQKLDAYFDHLFKNQKFMGSVAISHNDSLIYAKSVGYANAEKKIENTKDTKFRIGSQTKTFTAVLILKAVEEKKLKLSDKLASYYPQVKNAGEITIEQLLKHRSGIFNFTEIDGAQQWEQQYHTEKEFLAYLAKEKSNFKPGTAYEYSNTNYAILGFILQKVYRKTFAKLLDEKIAKPLHLQNTYYTFEVNPPKKEALSYNIQDTYLKNAKVNFSNHPASGGIVSTAVDVNKFLFALFNNKLISAKSLAMMLPVEKGAYGFGIEKLTFANPVGYEHGGRVENYFSDYWYFPKENLGVVVLSNAININLGDISTVLLKFAFNQQPELPNFNRIKELPEAEFTKIKGTYSIKGDKETITISTDGQYLTFQSSRAGQDYVYFEYKGNHLFKCENISLQFFPEKNEMYLEQGSSKEIYLKR